MSFGFRRSRLRANLAAASVPPPLILQLKLQPHLAVAETVAHVAPEDASLKPLGIGASACLSAAVAVAVAVARVSGSSLSRCMLAR